MVLMLENRIPKEIGNLNKLGRLRLFKKVLLLKGTSRRNRKFKFIKRINLIDTGIKDMPINAC